MLAALHTHFIHLHTILSFSLKLVYILFHLASAGHCGMQWYMLCALKNYPLKTLKHMATLDDD